MFSRSTLVALGAWVAMLGAAAVVAMPRWSLLEPLPKWKLSLAFGLAFLGASLAASAISRIVNPRLKTPLLIQTFLLLGGAALVIAAAFHSKDTTHDSLSSSSSSSSMSSSSNKKGEGMGLGWAIFATLVCLGIYGAGLFLVTSFARPAVQIASTTSPSWATTGSASPAPPAKRDIVDAPDLAAAIATATTETDPKAAATELARYLAAKTPWTELVVAKNETTLAAAARGKRVCVAGTVARADKQTARIATKLGALEVIFVGPPAAKRKASKFCGVVTGKANKIAVAAGMFEPRR